MTGVRNQRPITPKYSTTWDTDQVVNFLNDMDDTDLRSLTLKLTMLLALISSRRVQMLSKLKNSEMVFSPHGVELCISEALRTIRPGEARVKCNEYTLDKRLCPVPLITTYLGLTKQDRQSDNILVSIIKPHKAVRTELYAHG